MDRILLIKKLVDAIKSSKGDPERNRYLIRVVNKNKEISNSDKAYLKNYLGINISGKITESKPVKKIPKKDKTVFLNPNLIKCTTCDKEIKFIEKSIRYKKKWHHANCIDPILEVEKSERRNLEQSETSKKSKKRMDPISILLTAAIFVVLIGSVFFLLGPISMIAMGLGGAITVYHMIGASGKLFSKNVYASKTPSVFLLFLLGSPFLIATMSA